MRFYNLAEKWKEFEEIFTKIDEYRKEFIAEAPTLFGEIKTSVMDSGDVCFMQTQFAYEWTVLAQPFLETYFDVHKSHGTQKALKKILNDGVAGLNNNQKLLEQSVQSIEAMQKQTIAFRSKFNVRFVEKIVFVSNKLKNYRGADVHGPNGAFRKLLEPNVLARMQTLRKFDEDSSEKIGDNLLLIGNQLQKLMDEIEQINNLKTKIYLILTMLDAELEAPDENKLSAYAHDLIAACKIYRERYNRKENLV